jgi:hypothetical protein
VSKNVFISFSLPKFYSKPRGALVCAFVHENRVLRGYLGIRGESGRRVVKFENVELNNLYSYNNNNITTIVVVVVHSGLANFQRVRPR